MYFIFKIIIGVCLYVFFVGALPFAAKDPAETQRKILHAEYGDSNYIPLGKYNFSDFKNNKNE